MRDVLQSLARFIPKHPRVVLAGAIALMVAGLSICALLTANEFSSQPEASVSEIFDSVRGSFGVMAEKGAVSTQVTSGEELDRMADERIGRVQVIDQARDDDMRQILANAQQLVARTQSSVAKDLTDAALAQRRRGTSKQRTQTQK